MANIRENKKDGKEKLEVCRDKLHGYDYSAFNGTSDLARSKAISGAVNFILGKKEDAWKQYVKEAYLLVSFLTLCSL